MKSSTWRTVASLDTRTYGLSNGLRGKVKCGVAAVSKHMNENSYNLKVLKFYLIVIDAIFSPE